MSLLLSFEVWFIAALLLVALDVMLGLDFILLSFGIGAAVTGSSLLLKDALPMPFTGSWEALLTFFAVFSLLILVPLRRWTKKPAAGQDDTDINKYLSSFNPDSIVSIGESFYNFPNLSMIDFLKTSSSSGVLRASMAL